MVTKKDLLSSELLKEVAPIRLDSLWHMIALKRAGRFPAIDAMQLLDGYSRRLVGPVLDGSAGKHARVTLHLFCDEAETLVLDFLARRMPFKQEQKRLRYSDRNFQTLPVFLIEVDNCTIELLVFPAISLRQAPPSPIDGKPQQRANQAELERLVKRTTSAA